MFRQATSFNGDISKWDVSSVSNMDHMFWEAASFNQKLCGAAWVHSEAVTTHMFEGSSGSVSRTVCTSTPAQAATLRTRQYASRRSIPERELIVRTSIFTSDNTPPIASTIANTLTCPQCGAFKKSGKASCCATGGTWFKNCGGVGNRNVDHRWFEGVQACARKCKTHDMQAQPCAY